MTNKNELYLNSQEEALTKIVEDVSNVSRELIRGNCRVTRIAIPRYILGYMLRTEVGSTAVRAGKLLGRNHASVLKYVKDHDKNYRYFQDYRTMYLKIRQEYIVGFRGAKIQILEEQMIQFQIQLDILKEQEKQKLNINQKQ